MLIATDGNRQEDSSLSLTVRTQLSPFYNSIDIFSHSLLRKQSTFDRPPSSDSIIYCGFQTKLFVTSEVPVFQVFSDDPSEEAKQIHISDHMRSVMDDLVGLVFVPWLNV